MSTEHRGSLPLPSGRAGEQSCSAQEPDTASRPPPARPQQTSPAFPCQRKEQPAEIDDSHPAASAGDRVPLPGPSGGPFPKSLCCAVVPEPPLLASPVEGQFSHPEKLRGSPWTRRVPAHGGWLDTTQQEPEVPRIQPRVWGCVPAPPPVPSSRTLPVPLRKHQQQQFGFSSTAGLFG